MPVVAHLPFVEKPLGGDIVHQERESGQRRSGGAIMKLRHCKNPQASEMILSCHDSVSHLAAARARCMCRLVEFGATWDGWDALGRPWDARKSENRPCTPALGRWDGCTPPRHPLPSAPAAAPFWPSSSAPAICTNLHQSTVKAPPGALPSPLPPEPSWTITNPREVFTSD